MSSKTKQAGAADETAAPDDVKQDTTDPRDAELASLRAELAAVKQPAAQDEPTDPRDRTIVALRAELERIRSTPEGANAEMARALAALDAKVSAMQAGTDLVPLPSGGTDPYLYGVVLECGDVLNAQHPNATHTHCPEHGTVPVRGHWTLSDEMRTAANAK